MSKQHINGKKSKSIDRQRLEQVVINKYMAIWGHERIQDITELYTRIAGMTAALDEKGISYDKDLKSAIKFSPLENADLALEPEDFKKMVAEVGLQRLRRVNEDFDIIFMWLDDGYCVQNLHNFIACKNYALANYGRKKPTYGYDPDFCSNGRMIPHHSHSVSDDN